MPLIFGGGGAAAYTDWLAGETRAGYDIIFVAGQSNAVGTPGQTLDLTDRRSKVRHPRLFSLRNLDDSIVPIDFSDTFQLNHVATINGVAPTVHYAQHYLLNSGVVNQNRRVLIVPRALGGSGFDGSPNSWTAPAGNLFTGLRDDTLFALNSLVPGQTANYNRIILGHWNQGETNLNYTADAYGERYINLMLELKKALAAGLVNLTKQPKAFSISDVAKIPIINVTYPSAAQSFVGAKADSARTLAEIHCKLPRGTSINPDILLSSDAGLTYSTITAVNATTNVVTFNKELLNNVHSVTSKIQTGDKLRLNAPLPAGLTAGEEYFAVKTGILTYSFATTLANALSGAVVDITGTTVGGSYCAGLGTAIDVLHTDYLGILQIDTHFPRASEAAFKNLGNIITPTIEATQIAPTEVVVYSDDFADDTFGNITPYSIQYKLSSSSTWAEWTQTPSSSAYLITGLTQGATYDFKAVTPNAIKVYTKSSNIVTVVMSLATEIIDARFFANTGVVLNSGNVSSWTSATQKAGDSPYIYSQATAGNQPPFIANANTFWPFAKSYISLAGNASPTSARFLSGNSVLQAWTAGKGWVAESSWINHSGVSGANGFFMSWSTPASDTILRWTLRNTGNTAIGTASGFSSLDSPTRIAVNAISPAPTVPNDVNTFNTNAFFTDLQEASGFAGFRVAQNGNIVASGQAASAQPAVFAGTSSLAATLGDDRNTTGVINIRNLLLLSGTGVPPSNLNEILKALHYYLRSV
jgi:hypothetical protein